MISRVVPLVSMSNATDWQYWADQGWKGALGTIFLVVVLFALYKGKIGIESFGPNEAGIREFLGIKFWRIGPGPHVNIEGFWKARKTSTGVFEVKLKGEFHLKDKFTWQYDVDVFLHVQDTKQALIANIYRAQDLNRENMENSEAVKQVTAILKRNLRVILERGCDASAAETQLEYESHRDVLREYGCEIDSVLVTELVMRPLSELAMAVIKTGKVSDVVLPAAVPSGTPPHLEAIEGGIG